MKVRPHTKAKKVRGLEMSSVPDLGREMPSVLDLDQEALVVLTRGRLHLFLTCTCQWQASATHTCTDWAGLEDTCPRQAMNRRHQHQLGYQRIWLGHRAVYLFPAVGATTRAMDWF